ncbi:molybdopterin molybdotransferase MoeA [Paracrocinitomix mangrovi]|uniref:molybdopterin molybdotransferase MoeA n=1 Tax=Paracrocinitomix mangrovi TaxID=2862509 RepID=UPI001C8D8C2E|nr:gephyrin-like molybdotransferase Glp [Paracrocinitomix mangrovi]UKN01056.1 molybdopterin molybdotransferase MoeA [Paracrocinitomix mangrovi]
MISVDEAIRLVEANILVSDKVNIPIQKAFNLILADDVLSPIDMPPFPQSAMDGYAVNFDDNYSSYKLIGEIQAGSSQQFELQKGEAVRIFTGAAVPLTANMVVRQEDVTVNDSEINFIVPKLNANIRPQGGQIKKGELALLKNTELNPASIGFLSSLGIVEVPVFSNPRITILTTGNELVKAGNDLAYGQVYESNSIMLEAAFARFGYSQISHKEIRDDYQATLQAIEDALTSSDLLVLSGGISVGDYDFVGKALRELGVKEIFYKVNQKPGKPLFFGTKGNIPIFALPGNPAAALTSFYVYILPSIRKLSGLGFKTLVKEKLFLAHDYHRKSDRTEILKSTIKDGKVEILDGQSSAMLKSFSHSNALTFIPDTTTSLKEGDEVDVLIIE